MNVANFWVPGKSFNHNFYKWCWLLLLWLPSYLAKAQELKQDTLTEDQKMFLQASKLCDSAKLKEALPILKELIKLNPQHQDAWNKTVWIKITLKDYKGAEKDLKKAEPLIPFNYETSKLKGILYFNTERFKEAKVQFDTALYLATEDKLDDAELYVYRAQLMYKGKNNKLALESLESATDLKSNYTEAYMLKGEIRLSMKEYKHAVKELSEAIRLMSPTKTDYKAYKLRAKAYFELAEFKAAVQDWNVYIEAMTATEEDLVLRASAKINAREFSSAITDLDEAIKLNAKNPVSYCYRGVAKGENRMINEGLKDLDYAIKLKFDYAAAYVNRAALKMALKDKRGACEDLTKADSLGDEMALRLVEKFCKQR